MFTHKTKATMMMTALFATLAAVQTANAGNPAMLHTGTAQHISAATTGAPNGDWFVSLNSSSHHAEPRIGFGWGFGFAWEQHCDHGVVRVVRRPVIRRAVVVQRPARRVRATNRAIRRAIRRSDRRIVIR